MREVVERSRKEYWDEDLPPHGVNGLPEPYSHPFWPVVLGEKEARLEVAESWKGPVVQGNVWLSYRTSPLTGVGFEVGEVVTVIGYGSLRSSYRVHACSTSRGAPDKEFRAVLERYRSRIADLTSKVEDDAGKLPLLQQLYQTFFAYRDFERAHETAMRMAALRPNNLMYQSMAAKALLESDPIDKSAAESALQSFERILAASPLHAHASHGRTLALLRLQREDEIDPAARDFSFLNVPHGSEFGVDLSGRDLEGASFRSASVSRLILIGANVIDADFGGARIWQSAFYGADLAGTNFAPSREPLEGGYADDLRTDLYFVLFRNANLRGANFADTSMRGVHLEGADLSAADFSGAQPFGAVLTGARYDCATRWPEGFDPVAAGAVLTEPGC